MAADEKWCVASLVSWRPYVSYSVANGFEAVLGRPLASPSSRESGIETQAFGIRSVPYSRWRS
jgi:hypothetical protein